MMQLQFWHYLLAISKSMNEWSVINCHVWFVVQNGTLFVPCWTCKTTWLHHKCVMTCTSISKQCHWHMALLSSTFYVRAATPVFWKNSIVSSIGRGLSTQSIIAYGWKIWVGSCCSSKHNVIWCSAKQDHIVQHLARLIILSHPGSYC